jgi:hypothetical protein
VDYSPCPTAPCFRLQPAVAIDERIIDNVVAKLEELYNLTKKEEF